jgi:hypothetical protein
MYKLLASWLQLMDLRYGDLLMGKAFGDTL